MGAGRGRSRRAQAAVAASPRPQTGSHPRRKGKGAPLTQEERQAREEATKQMLITAVDKMHRDPAAAKRCLSSISRFRGRSLNNIALLLWQRPDVSRVAGYKEWQQRGFQVRKGEKGLVQLAPIHRRVAEVDPGTQRPVVDPATGKQVTRNVMLRGRFSTTRVFDISQCDRVPDAAGDAAASSVGGEGSGEGSGEESVETGSVSVQSTIDDLKAISKKRGLELVGQDEDGDLMIQFSRLAKASAGGWYSPEEEKVVLQRGLTPEQEARVWAHELAHHELGHGPYEDQADRQAKEMQAESVAYVLLSARGLGSDYSAAYIAGWCDSQLDAQVRAIWDTVNNAARAVLDELYALEDER